MQFTYSENLTPQSLIKCGYVLEDRYGKSSRSQVLVPHEMSPTSCVAEALVTSSVLTSREIAAGRTQGIVTIVRFVLE